VTCREIMTPNPTTCTPMATAQAAALIMSEEDVGIVPVVDPETSRLVGVVTDRDLCLDVIAEGKNPQEVKVSECLMPRWSPVLQRMTLTYVWGA
jgi:CBS domain-containing protein